MIEKYQLLISCQKLHPVKLNKGHVKFIMEEEEDRLRLSKNAKMADILLKNIIKFDGKKEAPHASVIYTFISFIFSAVTSRLKMTSIAVARFSCDYSFPVDNRESFQSNFTLQVRLV